MQRDRTMKLESVVFQQPRLNKNLTPEELKKIGSPAQKLPEGPDSLADFDCIILGDAEAEQLPLADRQRLEKYVADRGGTLVLLAGKRALPLGYPDVDNAGEADPLRKMLPIEDAHVVAPEDGFHLSLTPEGRDTEFMKLDAENAKSDTRWAELPKHYWAVVGKVKPGARALAFVNVPPAEVPPGGKPVKNKPEENSAVIVRQNYGRFRMCYEQGLGRNPNLEGRVSARFVIGRDGAVSNASNGGSDLPDSGVVSCVVSAFYGLSFPQPEGGIVTVVYPIMLSPG